VSLLNRFIVFCFAGSIILGSGSASADKSLNWIYQAYGNGAGTCSLFLGSPLGDFCMMSVTGWIQIGPNETQQQQVGCQNNATAEGLKWSLYNNQPFVNNGPWYYTINIGITGTALGFQVDSQRGRADLFHTDYTGNTFSGGGKGDYYGLYGYSGLKVYNLAAYGGYWQAAIGCLNKQAQRNRGPLLTRVIESASSEDTTGPAINNTGMVTMDSVDNSMGTAFLVRDYSMLMKKMVTDTRECPSGMKLVGKPTWTIQEFTADHQAPQWKDRAIVKVQHKKMSPTQMRTTMRMVRGKHPTVLQFQIPCSK
jgi:hypothetical protein